MAKYGRTHAIIDITAPASPWGPITLFDVTIPTHGEVSSGYFEWTAWAKDAGVAEEASVRIGIFIWYAVRNNAGALVFNGTDTQYGESDTAGKTLTMAWAQSDLGGGGLRHSFTLTSNIAALTELGLRCKIVQDQQWLITLG